MALRLDDTGFGGIRVLQDPEGFCYGVDAVMLSDFAAGGAAKLGKNCRIMDLGTGNGIIPLILSHKTEAGYIGGIEIQEGPYKLALENAKINGLEDRVHFFYADVRNFPLEGHRGEFNLVTSNPPYVKEECGLEGKNKEKSMARRETGAGLADFCRAAAALLKDKGEFCMIHRPQRLPDIFENCGKYSLEPKELVFISGRPMEKPNMLLIRCVKNGRRELKVSAPIAVRGRDGEYSEDILKMYGKQPKTVAIKW